MRVLLDFCSIYNMLYYTSYFIIGAWFDADSWPKKKIEFLIFFFSTPTNHKGFTSSGESCFFPAKITLQAFFLGWRS